MINFSCELAQLASGLERPWEQTIVSGHATLALRSYWQRQLRRCHTELGIRHVRLHALLSDQMGTLLCENDKLLYSYLVLVYRVLLRWS